MLGVLGSGEEKRREDQSWDGYRMIDESSLEERRRRGRGGGGENISTQSKAHHPLSPPTPTLFNSLRMHRHLSIYLSINPYLSC